MLTLLWGSGAAAFSQVDGLRDGHPFAFEQHFNCAGNGALGHSGFVDSEGKSHSSSCHSVSVGSVFLLSRRIV